MCGIAGVYSTYQLEPEDTKMFFANWVEMQERGRDAAGIFAVVEDRRGGRGVLYYKMPYPAIYVAPVVQKYLEEQRLSIVAAIAHTRLATHGSPSFNRNNHPLVRVKGNYVYALVHNGIVHMDACKYKYTETDSENLLCSAIRGKFDNIVGSAAIAYMVVDMSREYDAELVSYILYRQINPIMVLKRKDVIHFASMLEGGKMLKPYKTFDLTKGDALEYGDGEEACDTCSRYGIGVYDIEFDIYRYIQSSKKKKKKKKKKKADKYKWWHFV